MVYSVEAQLGEKKIVIETGKMARQAGGSVTVRCEDTIVLVTHETYTAGYADRIIKLLDGKIISDGKITGTVLHRHFKK